MADAGQMQDIFISGPTFPAGALDLTMDRIPVLPSQGSISPANFNTAVAGSVPSWVTDQRAPSGALPFILLDFQNGLYWASGAVVALNAVLVENLDWGAYDPSAVVAGHGLGAQAAPGANNALPTLVRGILGPAFISGATFVCEIILTGDLLETSVVADVEFVSLPDFNSEYGSQVAWMSNRTGIDVLPTSTAQVINQTDNLNNILTLPEDEVGVHRQAVTVAASGLKYAIDGTLQTALDATVTQSTPFTDIALFIYSSGPVLSYMQKLIVYLPQPEADLPALSTS